MKKIMRVISLCLLLLTATAVSVWGFDGADNAGIKQMAEKGYADAQ